MAIGVKLVWTGVLALTLFFALIDLIISAILVRSYNDSGYPSTHFRDVIRFTLFVSCWNIFIGGAFIAINFLLFTSVAASIAANLGYTFLLWIFWLASAASTESASGGAFSCSNPSFAHCHQILAMEAFAWINFIIYIVAFFGIAFLGFRAQRSGSGLMGPLAGEA